MSEILKTKRNILDQLRNLVEANPPTKENAEDWRDLAKEIGSVVRALDFIARDIIYPI